MSKNRSTTFFSIIILFAVVFYSFYSLTPNSSWKGIADIPDFSVERALDDLEEISQKPHFPGTEDHNRVRDYLVNELETLGLEVEIQEQVAINKKWRAATNTKNILTKIDGSGQGNALMLLSHYDSNPHSAIGASDAGSGVVVILEAVRAFIETGKTPANDIIICFSDAEELGLLGANAFVNKHPWAKDVGLVLNLEARGSGGPSYMLMETNGGNKKLVDAFDKANMEYPLGNSLMYSVYKMLPNDTDLTVFREDGDINGFNFAFIGDHFDYHTEQDSFDRMDMSSFLHQASYLLSGLSYFSEADLSDLDSDIDYVYFNFPVLGMVFYPFSWVQPWVLLCTLVFVVLLFLGFSRRKLSVTGVLVGLLFFSLALVVTALMAFLGWKLLLLIHPQYNDILHGFTYNGYYYIGFFVSLTLTLCFLIYRKIFSKRNLEDLMTAPLLIWLLINIGIAFYLKGAGFFIIPVTILLIEFGILIFSTKKNTLLLFTLLAFPVILIFAPMIKMFPVGLGLKMLAISTVFTTLIFGFLIPILHSFGKSKRIIKVLAILTLVLLVMAEMKSDYTEDRKAPNSIIYVLDSNSNEAYWRTYNQRMDAFTSQFFENKEAGSFYKNGTASKYSTKTRHFAKAPLKDLPKPNIYIKKDTIIGAFRKIDITIYSKREANKIELMANVPMKFKEMKVNQIALNNKNDSNYVLEVNGGSILSYYLTDINEMLEIEFVLDKEQPFDLDVLEAKFDLLHNPAFEITPRTKEMIPMPFVLNDATIIKTTIKL